MWNALSSIGSVVGNAVETIANTIEGAETGTFDEMVLLPWAVFDDEERRVQCETLVRGLSEHRRTFMEPAKAEFEFDFNLHISQAQELLKLDSNLARWRWDIVPGKISEEKFFRNYFYRVNLVVDSLRGDELLEPVASPIAVAQEDLAVEFTSPVAESQEPEKVETFVSPTRNEMTYFEEAED